MVVPVTVLTIRSGYDPGFLDIFTRMSNDLVHTSTSKGPLEVSLSQAEYIRMCTSGRRYFI